MYDFFVTEDNGMTTAGYVVCILVGGLLLLASGLFRKKKTEKTWSAKQLAFCAMAMALAYATSYIKLIHMPYGGSVTLFSMLFITLTGYWFGSGVGLVTGFAYGILQFLQGPYILSFFQVCCDYLLAYMAMGLSGFFCNSKNGLLKGYLVAILARGAFHSLGGYLYWMDYMPDNFPKSLTAVYPIVYNYSYILAEGLITVIVLLLPPVKKAMANVKRIATQD